MTKLPLLIALLFIMHLKGFSQENLNDYKYVIVPNNFEFLKGNDQYQLNSLTKFLFEKYGFTAIMSDDKYPDDLSRNNCLALMADVLKDPGIFKTKLQVELKNCEKEVVYVSKTGESREKQFQKAYHAALREAFISFESVNYEYQPNSNMSNNTSQVNNNQPKEPLQVKKEIQPSLGTEMEIETDLEEAEVISNTSSGNTTEMLYAQPITNGFQVVDTEPKKVMVLYYSGIKDVFIVQGKDAIVFKKDEGWMYSENDGTNLKAETLNIKF